uniref:Alpha-amylase n=1 Tax=Dermatophagoides farinae TaxID=6954 RepID=A0A023NMA7_DERFA|nr:Der f 4 allergen [Dermatophagoides farinae]
MLPKFFFILITVLTLLVSLFVNGDSKFSNPHFIGNRSVITHLMEWKYDDIGDECERFLGPYGYGGVQVSPVNEHAIMDGRPWYERYQPVSYDIHTRSGDEQQFRRMVQRCNKAGVRIYVDIVLNHMTGGQSGLGTNGHHYDGVAMQYPGVPFGPNDFHGHETCPTNDLEIHNYSNRIEARNCRLVGLRDLKQQSEYVKQKQVDFLNHLIDIGVAGFRSDASTHQWPDDLRSIYSRLHNLNNEFFTENSHPFIYHETIYYGGNGINSNEYTSLGRIIEFRFYKEITNVFRNNNQLRWLRNFGTEWGLVPSGDALVMIDSHDLRVGHTGQLGFNINCFEARLLKAATAFMLAWNYGIPRVMSSYFWDQIIRDGKDVNDWVGPPTDQHGNILSVHPNPDMTCNHEWICEHRWREIYNMVKFKLIAGQEPVNNWWDNGDNQIAFSRGNRAFIAINLQKNGNDHDKNLQKRLQTGLPPGIYCDIISGNLINNRCMGKSIQVDKNGLSDIYVGHDEFDAFVAYHIDARVES